MPLFDTLKFDLAVAQYDYSLGSVAGADADDFSSNVIGPDGRYVSDFDLFNVLASATFGGWNGWPLKLAGDYVVNRGARVPGDTGYSVELTAGQSRAQGDWRFGYGYSQAEVDAVLAAFSNDNTQLSRRIIASTRCKRATTCSTTSRSRPSGIDYRPYDRGLRAGWRERSRRLAGIECDFIFLVEF